MLPGAVAAGTYSVLVGGYVAGAHLHFDVVYRPAADAGAATDASSAVIASGDGTIVPTDAGFGPPLRVTMTGAAVPAVCGDRLVLRMTYVSGPSDFYEVAVQLTIP